MNLRLSNLLKQEVLSLASNDDGMDAVCLSRNGEPLSLACLSEAEVQWAVGESVRVRPMLGEGADDEPPEMLVDPEVLEAVEEIDGVAVAPAVMMTAHLHALSMRRQAEFLGGRSTFLDLGSFDCLERVPEPIARSEKSGGGLWPFGRGRS